MHVQKEKIEMKVETYMKKNKNAIGPIASTMSSFESLSSMTSSKYGST